MPSPPPLSSSSWTDALRYPLLPAAVAANLVLALGQLIAGAIGGAIGLVFGLLLWIGLYGYALEILAASAAGREEPPEVLTEADAQTRRSHVWLQVLLFVAVIAATGLAAPALRFWLLAAIAAVMPGALLALTIGQRLLAALNPANWLLIASRLGTSYAVLAAASFALLNLQLFMNGLATSSGAGLLLMPLTQMPIVYAVFALFRLMGLALRANAEAFGHEVDIGKRPTLQRDREQAAVETDVAAALQVDDPAERAALLARTLRRGASDVAHREYRRALRETGQGEALRMHAGGRVCELLALGQPRPALVLATEALDDAPGFALDDSDASLRLVELAERQGMARLAASIAANYARAYPRRRDGIPLALRAAALLGGRLAQPDAARRLLDEVAELAADGEFAPAIEAARRALDAVATTAISPIRESR